MHLFRLLNKLFEFKMRHKRSEMLVKLANFLEQIWSFAGNAKTKTAPNDGEFPVVKNGTPKVGMKGGVQVTAQTCGQ